MALIEEFVTRDGALHGHVDTPVDAMVASVLGQLEAGNAVVVFDADDETASIVIKDSLRARPPDMTDMTDMPEGQPDGESD